MVLQEEVPDLKPQYHKYTKQFFTIILSLFVLVSSTWAGSQQTSTTLASTIITNVRAYLNEDATANTLFWSDAELLVWLNDGLVDLVARSRCLETTEVVTLVSGTLEYTLSTAYIGITGAIYTDGSSYKALKMGDIREAGHAESDSGPEFWYEWNGKVGIYPLATADTAGDTVVFYMIERPSAIASTASITVPAYFDHILTMYIVAQAYMKDTKVDMATLWLQEYYKAIDRFRLDYTHHTKKPDEVK